MDGDVKSTATAVFNNLNRYLNLLNYRPSGDENTESFSGNHFAHRNLNPFESDLAKLLAENSSYIAHFSDLDFNFNTILSDINWEDDTQSSEPKNALSQLSRGDTEDSALISEATSSQADALSKEDDELISNLSSDRANESDEKSFVGTADSNFVSYTYWSVETGANVSTTTRPAYVNARNCRVSLLQESEAFVAKAIWGPDNTQLKFTPRHLLLQVTQIANRAFFDPDYRKYLQLNYV